MAFDPSTYQPSTDYQTAYDAANKRLLANFAAQRGQQTQEIASRGVATSGVASIPGETLDRGQAVAQAGLVGGLAEKQADTSIQDRRILEQQAFERQMAQQDWENKINMGNTIARRQLQGQLIGGTIGATGSYFQGAGRPALPMPGY